MDSLSQHRPARVVAFMLAAVALATLTACGTEEPKSSSTPNPVPIRTHDPVPVYTPPPVQAPSNPYVDYLATIRESMTTGQLGGLLGSYGQTVSDQALIDVAVLACQTWRDNAPWSGPGSFGREARVRIEADGIPSNQATLIAMTAGGSAMSTCAVDSLKGASE